MAQDVRCEMCGATFSNDELHRQHMDSTHQSSSPTGFPGDRERGGRGMEDEGGPSGITSAPGGARGSSEPVAEGLTEAYEASGEQGGGGADRSGQPLAESPGASGERYYTPSEGRLATGGQGRPAGMGADGEAGATEATPGSSEAEHAGSGGGSREGRRIGGGMEGEGLRGTDMESGEMDAEMGEDAGSLEGSREGERSRTGGERGYEEERER